MTLTEQVQEHLEDVFYPVRAKADVFCKMELISPTYLRRKLREEGTSWQTLVNAEIQRRVDTQKGEGAQLQDIAADVGYSHAQNLGRFLRVNG